MGGQPRTPATGAALLYFARSAVVAPGDGRLGGAAGPVPRPGPAAALAAASRRGRESVLSKRLVGAVACEARVPSCAARFDQFDLEGRLPLFRLQPERSPPHAAGRLGARAWRRGREPPRSAPGRLPRRDAVSFRLVGGQTGLGLPEAAQVRLPDGAAAWRRNARSGGWGGEGEAR